ncbi:MAG: SidE phosphodiesterase domain-containing protein [Gammaproteobacteria bacterium]
MPTLNMQSDIGAIADEIGGQYYRKGFPKTRLPDGTLDLSQVTPPPATQGVARRVHSYQNACRYAAAVPNIAALYKKHKDSFPANLQGEIDSLTDEDIKILQVVALMRASGRSSADPRNPDNPSLQAGGKFQETCRIC